MMTFAEIARELGVSHQAVYQTYTHAMNKLRRRHVDVQVLRELSLVLQSERELRSVAAISQEVPRDAFQVL
jgi:predicted DNA-binding protein YlxM (UPF0122 family)